MTGPQQEFVAAQYSSRAEAYVHSRDHSTGDDLDEIERELRGRGSAEVLDLGCGGGHASYRAAPHVKSVIACDITSSMLAAVAEQGRQRGLSNISVQQAAAEQLPFPDASFDAVLCRFTTHHWHSMEQGLREARRVLKSGGCAIFIDATAPGDRLLDTHLQAWELLRDSSHVRDYSVAEWASALARAGFSEVKPTTRRLRLDFPVWIARTNASPAHAEAIHSLQKAAPDSVRHYFCVADDGSFELDTATFVTCPA